jgi:folate-binding protein YgfZ
MMNFDWQSFLLPFGAQFEQELLIHFGQLEQERQATLQQLPIVTALSDMGLIKVSGVEAEKFLQGQFTNDIRQVTLEQSQLSAWCNAKGRMLVNFRIFQREAAYYLLLPRQCLEFTLKKLAMYVLRADVKLEAVNDSLWGIGIAGGNASEIVQTCLGASPPISLNASVTVEQTTVLQIQKLPPRYILVTEKPASIWECLAKQARSVGTIQWRLLDILAGIPQILPATGDAFVPQMVNYQELGGVNFKKGCYTGQEVVARMQYLADLKRRMYLARINTTTLPQPGDALYVANQEASVGTIVNAQFESDETAVVLAVIVIEEAKTNEIHWLTPQGEVLKLSD